MKALSRTLIERVRSAWIPHLAPAQSGKQGTVTRCSALQAQHLSLVLSSLMHASFFVMMGSAKGYITIFSAYVIATFSHAFLTGEIYYYFICTLFS